MILRDYQQRAIRAVADAFAASPTARVVVSLPTGTGKTVTGLTLARTLGRRTLWLAHRDELIEQPYAAARRVWPDAELGVVKAERNETDANDLVIASVQTAARKRRLRDLVGSGDFGLVVVDEAHHAAAPTYRSILGHTNGAPVLGLTATPERGDKRALGKVFPEGLVCRYPIKAAVEAGWLVPPVNLAGTPWTSERVILPGFHPERLRKSRRKDGDYDAELTKANFKEAAIGCTVTATRIALNDNRRPVVFTVSVSVARAVAEHLKADGAKAEWVSGETPIEERRDRLKRHRAGQFDVLLNCAVLTEGYDDPGLDAIVMARPTRSRPFYVQAIGRGLRSYCLCGAALNGEACSCAKTRGCLVVDLVGAHEAHGLVTSDTLAAEDEWLDEDPEQEKRDRRSSDPAFAMGADDAAISRLYNLLKAAAGDDLGVDGSYLDEASVRWLAIERGRCYALECGDQGCVLLDTDDAETWSVLLEPRDKAEQPIRLAAEASLELAQAYGEQIARDLGAYRLASKGAGWLDRPASVGQLNALRTCRVKFNEADPPSSGHASDLLTISFQRGRLKARRKGRRVAVDVTSGGLLL